MLLSGSGFSGWCAAGSVAEGNAQAFLVAELKQMSPGTKLEAKRRQQKAPEQKAGESASVPG